MSRRFALPVFAGGMFLLLLCLPATGWLIRTQIGMATPGHRSLAWQILGVDDDLLKSADYQAESAAVDRAAARHPDDLAVQLAYIIHDSAHPQAMASLEDRFSHDPVFYAAWARFLTMRAVGLRRDEVSLLYGEKLTPSVAPSTPDDLRTFNRACAAGERLDPENAYFPAVRAIGLFAAHQDDAALAALHRAAAKTHWDDYAFVEAEGGARLVDLAFGDRSGISSMYLAVSTLLPHFSGLRAAAQVAVYKAAVLEKHGQTEAGFMIRRDVSHLGALMRVQSRSIISSLVGGAISQIASIAPGGTIPARSASSKVGDESQLEARGREHLAAYAAYLRRIGHPEEAVYAERQYEAGRQVREIDKAESPWVLDFVGVPRLAAHWFFCLAILAAVGWTLLLGLAIWAWERSAPREGQKPDIGRVNYRRIAVGLGVAAGLLVGAVLLFRWLIWAFTTIDTSCRLLNHLLDAGDSFFWLPDALFLAWLRLLLAFGAFAVPLLIFLISGIIARRRPEGRTAARLYRPALSAAALFLLLYSGLVIVTVQAEAQARDSIQQLGQSEGRFLAAQLHRTWPD